MLLDRVGNSLIEALCGYIDDQPSAIQCQSQCQSIAEVAETQLKAKLLGTHIPRTYPPIEHTAKVIRTKQKTKEVVSDI